MDDNWASDVFGQFNVEFISYYWLHNRSLIISRTYDPETKQLNVYPLPPTLNVLPSFGGVDFSLTSSRAGGFLVPKDRNVTYLIGVVPVQDNLFNGPVKAVAVLGRRVTQSVISDISNRAQYCTAIYSSNDRNSWQYGSSSGINSKPGITPNITNGDWEDQNIGIYQIMKPDKFSGESLSGRHCWKGNAAVDNTTLNEERLGGFNIYNDIHGEKSVIFRIDVSRGINWLAQYSIIIVLSILAAVGVGFFFLIGCLLECFVLFRVTSLTSQIRRIKDSVDLSQRVGVLKGVDEVDYLTNNINQMLANVEFTQNQLKAILNQLGHEEEKTRLMLNSIPDSIAIVDPKTGFILEANSAFKKLISDNSREKIIYHILPEMNINEFKQAVGNCTETVAKLDTENIAVQVTTCSIDFFEEGNTIPYAMCVIKDMRERNEVMDKLQNEMKQLSEMEDQFTFEQEFRDPIIREAFSKFCKKDNTYQNVQFLEFVEEYKKLDQTSRIKNQKLAYGLKKFNF
jgi:methyl-accepting chemotaxis protein